MTIRAAGEAVVGGAGRADSQSLKEPIIVLSRLSRVREVIITRVTGD